MAKYRTRWTVETRYSIDVKASSYLKAKAKALIIAGEFSEGLDNTDISRMLETADEQVIQFRSVTMMDE